MNQLNKRNQRKGFEVSSKNTIFFNCNEETLPRGKLPPPDVFKLPSFTGLHFSKDLYNRPQEKNLQKGFAGNVREIIRSRNRNEKILNEEWYLLRQVGNSVQTSLK